ncbi:MAG: TetR/AcrR family transcriptional regulator [Moorellaceae bacterium]
MRIVKQPEVRREEIMNAAEELFKEKGVEETSVNDITHRAGIAKGTFYWYFKSKDELLDALVEREIDRYIERITPIVEASDLNAVEKLRRMLEVHNKICAAKDNLRDFFHRTENALTHQKHLILELKKTAPLLEQVVKQGIKEKLFNTDYPREIVEFLLLLLASLTNPWLLRWKREDRLSRFKALQDLFERALSAKPGTLSFLHSLLEICSTGT